MSGKTQTQAQSKAIMTGAERTRAEVLGPNFAEVHHYMEIARRLRAEAFADLVRRAYASLFRAGTAERPASHSQTQHGTPHRA